MTDLARYRNDIVLLYCEERLSINAIASRFAAAGEDVRRLLKIEGVELRSGRVREWRNSAEAVEDRANDREGYPARLCAAARQYRPDTSEEDTEYAARADRKHVSAIVRSLGGKGFPFFEIRGRL